MVISSTRSTTPGIDSADASVPAGVIRDPDMHRILDMSSTLAIDHAKVGRPSSLGRDIDPRVPSNRLAIAGALTAALVAGLAGLLDLGAGPSPVSAAIGVFLSWAIARELDPDHPVAAAVALPVSLMLLMLVGPSSLIVSTGVLLGLRMTAGTVGTPLRLLDIAGIVGLSALLGTSVVGIVGVAAMGVGVLVDEPRWTRATAIVAGAASAFTAAALFSGVDRIWTTPSTLGWVTLIAGIVATLSLIPAVAPASSTDRTPARLLQGRVTAARTVAGITVVAAFALAGGSGVAALAGTVTAALAGTAIRRVAAGLRQAPPHGRRVAATQRDSVR